MQDGLFDVFIRPNGRRPADEYYHNGSVWIEGREGSCYDIVIKNHYHYRIEAVVSVDGLSVIDGKPAGVKSRGYIIDAHKELTIPGWNVDNQTSAEFVFSKKGNSYVAQMNSNSNNVGVIGVMIFKEKNPLNHITSIVKGVPYHAAQSWLYPPYDNANKPMLRNDLGSVTSVNSTETSSASQNSIYHNLGTEFGQPKEFSTTSVTFYRLNQSTPDSKMVIYYDSGEGLQRRGIVLKTKRNKYYTEIPQAFPADTDQGCKPPPNWVKDI